MLPLIRSAKIASFALLLLGLSLFFPMAKSAQAQEDSLPIGFCGALTGRSSAYGISVKKGAELAVERINLSEGIDGQKLELLSVDDQQKERLSSEKITSLIYDSNVLAIIGTTDSGCTHVAARIAMKARVPLIATVATDPSLTRLNNPYVFRNLADDLIQGKALVKHMIDDRRIRDIAIVHVDTRYGRGGAAVVEEAIRDRKRSPLARLTFDSGQRDFGDLLSKLEKLRPKAMVLWGLYPEGAALTKATKERIPGIEIFGPDGLAAKAFIEEAGRAAEGVTLTYPFNPRRKNDPLVASFIEGFEEKYDETPDSFAAHAYDAVYQIAEAMKIGDRTSVV